jgi:hypothetical protein
MITYKRISVFAVLLIFLSFLGCATPPISYEKMIPEKYFPSYQSKIRANIVVHDGWAQECDPQMLDLYRLTPNEFKKALIKSAGQMITEQDGHPKFTLIVKNFNCCFGVGEFVKTTCTGKSYWALRDISSQHIVWQKHIEASGSGGYGLGNRIIPSRSNYAKQTIETGLNALSKVDLVVAEEKIEKLSDQWHTQRNADSFFELYNYLLFSSNTKIDRIRDGYLIGMQGNLMSTFTKQYVNDLIGEPDNILPGSGDNQMLEWVMKRDGKETVYRLSFYQNQLSGGSIKQQE